MLSYCLKCRKITKIKNLTFAKINKGKLTISLKCAVCGSEKSRFIREQNSSGLLSSLGKRAP